MNETHNPRFIAIKRNKGYAGSYIDLNCLEPCDLAFDEYVIYSRDDANKEMLDAKDAKLAEYKASHARLVKALSNVSEWILNWEPNFTDEPEWRDRDQIEFEKALAEAKALTGDQL